MKLTFYSNFLNHHQLPFCIEMEKILKDNFKFVATEKIPIERTKMGYEDMNKKYNFVVRSYENEEEAYRLGLESDIVIIGSANQKYIRERLKHHKLTFRYSERIFKNVENLIKCMPSIIKFKLFENNNVYLLCASAYSSSDFNKLGLYKNKTYKWGYFPMVKKYKNINEIIEKKEENSIIWVGRFIKYKHPENVIKIAKKLKDDNYIFTIKMIGIGKLEKKIRKQIIKNNLENNIKLLSSMSPEKVRENMEKCEIFIFTSDRSEGWGAVLNESMNSACAVIANNEIGAVPFLIKNKENGFIYKNGNIDDLYNKVKILLDDKETTKKIGLNAYKTIIQLWNHKIATKRLVELSKNIMNNRKSDIYKSGPCSRA